PATAVSSILLPQHFSATPRRIRFMPERRGTNLASPHRRQAASVFRETNRFRACLLACLAPALGCAQMMTSGVPASARKLAEASDSSSPVDRTARRPAESSDRTSSPNDSRQPMEPSPWPAQLPAQSASVPKTREEPRAAANWNDGNAASSSGEIQLVAHEFSEPARLQVAAAGPATPTPFNVARPSSHPQPIADTQPSNRHVVGDTQPSDQHVGETIAKASATLERARRGGSDAVLRTLQELEQATSELRATAPLTLRDPRFCERVDSFGDYQPFPRNRFLPGAEVLLYVEAENQVSEATEEGFHTMLGSRYEITDAAGKLASEHEFPVNEDFCRRRRRDYFHTYRFRLPENVRPGRYVLHLTMRDQLSGKSGVASLPFEIIDAPSH
ncbi:MAG: hypothetical protein N2C14_12295, partial [Planctomycetales bacterium]